LDSSTALPVPTIKTRKIDEQRTLQGVADGLHPVIARILASRPFDEKYTASDWLELGLQALDAPSQLADCDKAVARIVQAMQQGEVIGIETDHDCDGQTSHAVLYEAFITFFQYPKDKIRSYIGHRLKEGYGLSDKLVDRILADEPRPTLIITADNGSSDEMSIARLKAQQIDVIVTDHHEIPIEGIPQSAVAVINPTREDCDYPDRCIAGCMVAWLLMAAVRQGLLAHKFLPEIPRLGGLLDYVAVGTVADCVSIARSKNNRIVVSKGMQLIEKAKRPCWQALLPHLTFPLHSEDLGFKIGPLLNSDGRLACAFGSVSFLLANDTYEAKKWYDHLSEQNVARKSIQNRITETGLEQATTQYLAGKRTLCINMADGHAGVHGISASRIKDAFGRPTIIFCSKQDVPDVLTGSARSIPGLHLKNVLQKVKEMAPESIDRFGGHEGAAGLTIPKSQITLFSENFEKVVQNDFEAKMFGPVVWSDGELDSECLSQDFMEDLLDRLEPFGREFEPPQFEAIGQVASLQFMGAGKNHARLGLSIDDVWVSCVWFSCRKDEQSPAPVAVGDTVKVLYSPKVETFRGNKRLTCRIVHLEQAWC
tara:strand:- start:92798 stop:94585 length:1788 start_codon:yes stop_codon:yes gene_type:complete